MALGKNMKVEKLIPLKPKKGAAKKASANNGIIEEEQASSVINVSDDTSELIEDLEVVSENQSEEKGQEINVDLDDFLSGVDGQVQSQDLRGNDVQAEASDEVLEAEVNKYIQTEEPISVQEEVKSEEKKSNVFNQEDVETDSIKISFKPSRRKTQKRIFIDIEGDATIKNAELLYSNVNAVFAHFDHVEINMSNISAVDLSVIQLFHVIRVNYFTQDKFIYLNADFTRSDRKLLNTCGFTEFQTQKVVQN